MIVLSGYSIFSEIYSSSRTVVYRGLRQSDSQPVVLKMMRSEYPSFNQLVQFRNQYTIAKNLNLQGVIQPYSLENYCNGFALVMEDFGGISLKDYTNTRPVILSEFLDIAIQITATLEKLHRQRLIHKDIKPANLLINPHTKEIKITDFSISSLLPRESQALVSPNVLEGTLTYLSPEQTGRMNRGIDYRSDYYSLGITFYELLTGQLPFTTTDPMELVYCHIAKLPPSVHSINPEIPQVISDIIEKLMAKMAEDRYQSALGLKHDLETCQRDWENSGKIANFALGARDISDRFLIPEKLYGREKEVATLLAAFDRVAYPQENRVSKEEFNPQSQIPNPKSQIEIILVTGYSGIGKTAVVNEVHKPIVRQRGCFIRGKFDQFQRNIPFYAIAQALRDLISQLHSETPQQIEQWKVKILDAVGENGQVIIDVVPELERLIGVQPPVPELEPSAALNRFNLVFLKFMRVFSSPSHPLVIFLDDLQWADSASLKLIELLMSETDMRYLLLIGAYRDNEVLNGHPLMLTLEELRKKEVTVNTITLAPLNSNNLNRLIADTLICPPEIALPLTQQVYTKTKGNPFFSNQFLKALYEDGLINFNFEARYWQCDLAQVKAQCLTDDVVEFMALQLQKLPANTQEVLKLAACIGNSFDLNTLAIVYEKSPAETAADLWKALQEGLVIPKSEIYKFFHSSDRNLLSTANESESEQLQIANYELATYKFLHDRVQQAAYFLIPEERKKATHLKIGQLLLSNTPVERQEENILDIVNQLNYGAALISAPAERSQLAQLNLIAGRKVKASTAYTAALRYLTTGMKLLPKDSWQNHYDLTLALHEEAAEAAYLCGNFELMNLLFEDVLQQAKTLLDKVKVYEVKLQAYAAQKKFVEAIETALPILEQLGVSFPKSPSQLDIQYALESTAANWNSKQIEDLINLPDMTEADKKAALRFLASITAAAYIAIPQLLPLIVCEEINLSIKYGNAPLSAYSYAIYGTILCGVVGNLEAGYQFGQLALKTLARFHAKEITAKVSINVGGDIKHWQEHGRETLKFLRSGYQIGLETGDLEFAAYCGVYECFNSYLIGAELSQHEQEVAIYSRAFSQFKQETVCIWSAIHRQTVLNLMERSDRPSCLVGQAYNETESLPQHEKVNDRLALHILYFNKLTLSYIFGEFQQALANAEQAEKYLDGVTGMLVIPTFYLYDSLARMALYNDAPESEQKNILLKAIANQEKMENWANFAPMNHLHKLYLVQAELNRILDKKIEAMKMYDCAIAGAKENGYIQEEALADELAAKFYLEWGKAKIAQTYMIDAYYAYSRWGAKAKVEDLEKRYPELLTPILQQEKITFNLRDALATHPINKTISSTSKTISDVLDIYSVIKASQALSEEINLDKLLSKLMQVLMENAGAQKACLILTKSGNLDREALAICSSANGGSQSESIIQSIPIYSSTDTPMSIVNYVQNTKETLVIDDGASADRFTGDPYIIEHQPKSILCTPLLNQGHTIAILYLENNLTKAAFTSDRLEVLKVLCSQAAISLENARLYQESQNYAKQLEDSLEKLQEAQIQIVQGEKMATLGQLMAGIAHEINNPLGFIAGNIDHALEYTEDVIDHLSLYQQHYPEPAPEIEDDAEDIDLEFVLEDLPKMLSSMKQGTDRIRNISNSMRTFSRLDNSNKIRFNIHEGIDSTLVILHHRLKAKDTRPAVEVVKNYGELPEINCYPGQLNQVFMNILGNAIDALDQANNGKAYKEIEKNPNRITITTEIDRDNSQVAIRIADNGVGIPPEVKERVFEHLFTTKPVGKGTGLGLSISRQIVEKEHSGKLSCTSSIGQGTEFAIVIPIE
ncbi:trifunctional serine/threonine-protein kinase/ATP-binding protein/sensor histidine kinase [Aerosakkonema funiforme]|uniref:histidine kinase n=2 Tax=Oscillatoriophycideae TaxID=1301283 RepID=A0A926ZLF1_9CYAN|nr:ATP-binding sensor histidine kinase [Aerosakkonema funiforme]MBD2186337.1 AAA family ATPase [Aerosakkonema funiforme FACHB-1375]